MANNEPHFKYQTLLRERNKTNVKQNNQHSYKVTSFKRHVTLLKTIIGLNIENI